MFLYSRRFRSKGVFSELRPPFSPGKIAGVSFGRFAQRIDSIGFYYSATRGFHTKLITSAKLPTEIASGQIEHLEPLKQLELVEPQFVERFERSAAVERLERLELAATLVSDMPDVAGQKVAVCAWHRFRFLRSRFLPSKSYC